MEREKIKGYLNLSRKAGYLIIGGEALENYTKKLYLVLYDKSSANNTLKIVEKIRGKGISTIAIDNLEELASISNCKIVGLKNKNMSDIIISLTNK